MVAETNQAGLKWLERTIPSPPVSYADGGFVTPRNPLLMVDLGSETTTKTPVGK
ncbi:MAG: hypothetical protein ACFFD4_03640 [Candidatus Odinarchaeota archaeon]